VAANRMERAGGTAAIGNRPGRRCKLGKGCPARDCAMHIRATIEQTRLVEFWPVELTRIRRYQQNLGKREYQPKWRRAMKAILQPRDRFLRRGGQPQEYQHSTDGGRDTGSTVPGEEYNL
jgi:hypothetical protein